MAGDGTRATPLSGNRVAVVPGTGKLYVFSTVTRKTLVNPVFGFSSLIYVRDLGVLFAGPGAAVRARDGVVIAAPPLPAAGLAFNPSVCVWVPTKQRIHASLCTSGVRYEYLYDPILGTWSGSTDATTIADYTGGGVYVPSVDRVFYSYGNLMIRDCTSASPGAEVQFGGASTYQRGVAYSPRHDLVAAVQIANVVDLINPHTPAVVHSVTVQTAPGAVCYSPHDARFWVATTSSGPCLVAIDPIAGKIVRTVPIGTPVVAITPAPTGKLLYAFDANGNVWEVDVDAGIVTATFSIA